MVVAPQPPVIGDRVRQNLGDQWVTDGFTFVGLALTIRADWKYVPAVKVVDF